MQRHWRTLTGHLWGISALWLLALALCLLGWSLLSGPGDARLTERVAHAAEITSQELGPGLSRSNPPALGPQVRALLARQDVGFAWLRVRDTQGRAVAAAGRLKSGTLSRQIYPLISTDHRVALTRDGREVGTLEFGLLVGGGNLGATGGRLALGLLALLLGVPALALLSLRLKTVYLQNWSDSGKETVRAATRLEPASRAAAPTVPALSPAAGELMAVFDRAGVVVDRSLVVRDFNEQAERLTGWPRDQACGQLLSKILVLTESEARRPLQPALEACLRGTRDRIQDLYVLRTRDGALRDVDIDAGPLRDPSGRIGGVLLSLRQVEKKTPDVLERIVPAGVLAPSQDPRRVSQMLLDQVLECVITTDSQDRIQFANGRALENFGYALTELRGMHISRLLPVPFLKQTRVSDYALTLPDMPAPEVIARRRDGSQYSACLMVRPVSLRDRQGHVMTVRPVMSPADGPTLNPALRHLLNNALEEVYVIDPDTLQLMAGNHHALRNLGCNSEQLAQLTLLQLCPRLTPAQLQAQMIHLLPGESGQASFRTWHQRADGSSYEVQARIELWSVEPPSVLLLVSQALGTMPHRHDIALREDKLGFLAHHDALTGLPNHALFMERLHQVIVACQQERLYFAVVQLALPELAEVSKAQGHETGDLLLKAVADRLSATVRSADTVAHLGDNEFTLIMTGLKERQDISGTLKRLQQALSNPLRAGSLEFMVRPCLGAAVYPDDGDTPELLMRHAGLALHEAATKGPGQACLYDAVLAAHVTPTPTGPFEQLREAQKQGQLGIELQALTDVRARQVVGAEVLLAWRYPGRPGLLRTAEQVLQATVNDTLAAAVSFWALERACDQQVNWRDLELPSLPLLMNLSALPLTGRRNEQALHRLLARYRVPPEQLIMMVNMDALESLLLDPDSELPMLRDLGMRIGVNNVDSTRVDLLRRADVDVVQLTPRNIIGLPGTREAADQCAAIVQAGQRVGAQIFASGVERAEQREALLALGCHIQQGRLLSEPLEPREFSLSLLRAEVGAF